MRDYTTLANLRRASALAALITAMSVGRLVEAGVSLRAYVPLTFMSMLFVCGAATAWGGSAGMAGLATDRGVLWRGLGVVACLLLLALPVYRCWFDPVLRHALAEAGRPGLVELSYPGTARGRWALLLWSAGFQAMFFVAAPMAYFARLTRSVWSAAALCIVARGFLVFRQLAANGIVDGAPFFVCSALASTFAACLVFARYGLAPTMAFAAGLDLRTFLE